jgi:hypothetical protein
MQMEERTLVRISISNDNKIKIESDFSGIENDEEALRFIHSIVDELRDNLLDHISEVKQIEEDEE